MAHPIIPALAALTPAPPHRSLADKPALERSARVCGSGTPKERLDWRGMCRGVRGTSRHEQIT
jgi:hypothetical protein